MAEPERGYSCILHKAGSEKTRSSEATGGFWQRDAQTAQLRKTSKPKATSCFLNSPMWQPLCLLFSWDLFFLQNRMCMGWIASDFFPVGSTVSSCHPTLPASCFRFSVVGWPWWDVEDGSEGGVWTAWRLPPGLKRHPASGIPLTEA